MIQINNDDKIPGDDEDFSFAMIIAMLGYVEDDLLVEGTINDRWFGMEWGKSGKVFVSISRKPMCREDFWEWHKKCKPKWYKSTTMVDQPIGEKEEIGAEIAKLMSVFVMKYKKSLKLESIS